MGKEFGQLAYLLLPGLRHLLNKKILTNRRNTAFFMSNFMHLIVACVVCL